MSDRRLPASRWLCQEKRPLIRGSDRLLPGHGARGGRLGFRQGHRRPARCIAAVDRAGGQGGPEFFTGRFADSRRKLVEALSAGTIPDVSLAEIRREDTEVNSYLGGVVQTAFDEINATARAIIAERVDRSDQIGFAALARLADDGRWLRDRQAAFFPADGRYFGRHRALADRRLRPDYPLHRPQRRNGPHCQGAAGFPGEWPPRP